jgi:hypothetical protein
VLVYRGVWDQSGPGFLTRVVRDHGHFRDVVPFHWALFEQGEEPGKAHGGAFTFVQAKPAEVAASARPHAPVRSRGSCTRSGWARVRCPCTSGDGVAASPR